MNIEQPMSHRQMEERWSRHVGNVLIDAIDRTRKLGLQEIVLSRDDKVYFDAKSWRDAVICVLEEFPSMSTYSDPVIELHFRGGIVVSIHGNMSSLEYHMQIDGPIENGTRDTIDGPITFTIRDKSGLDACGVTTQIGDIVSRIKRCIKTQSEPAPTHEYPVSITLSDEARTIFTRALERFGSRNQLVKLLEECGELSAEVARTHVSGDPIDEDAIFESADVIMLICQMVLADEHSHGMTALMSAIEHKLHVLEDVLNREDHRG